MKNYFSFFIKNQFVQSEEKEIHINYCGRKIGNAFAYLNDVHIEFTDNQPMIPMEEWKFLGETLKKIRASHFDLLKMN